MTGFYIETYAFGNDDDVMLSRKGPFPDERKAVRIERGMNINLDHENYFTVITMQEAPDA